MITLFDSRFDSVTQIPGVPLVRNWDGRNETYERLRAGMYVVHLHVVDSVTGKTIVKTAPVVVATRLQ